MSQIKSGKKLLVRAPNQVGDTILSRPALFWLSEAAQRQGGELWVLLHPHLRPLLQGMSVQLLDLPAKSGPVATFLLAQQLRQYRFDGALLLAPSMRAALEARLAGIPLRIGYPDDSRWPLLTHAVFRPARKRAYSRVPFHQHRVEDFVSLVTVAMAVMQWQSELLLPADTLARHERLMSWLSMGTVHAQVTEKKEDIKFELWQRMQQERTDMVRESAPELTHTVVKASTDSRARPLIGLHPLDSGGETRRWPLERYQALMVLLWKRLGAGLILHGGPGDGVVLRALARVHPGPVLVHAGETTLALDTLANVLLAEDCFVVGDTGPMHLAAALDVPGVALFGSTDPGLTGPFGGRLTLLHRAPSHCQGCYRRECPTQRECLTALSVEEVYDAVAAQLTQVAA